MALEYRGIELPEEMWTVIEAIAEDQGESRVAFIRQAIVNDPIFKKKLRQLKLTFKLPNTVEADRNRATVLSLKKAGKSVPFIVSQTGLSRGWIYRILRRASGDE